MNRNILAVGILAAAMIGACTYGQQTTQDSKDAAVVDRQQAHFAAVQPIPFFDFSMDRDTLIEIYKAKNEARLTWTVVQSMTGSVEWTCDSIGFAIPADTQLTNSLVPTGRWLQTRAADNGGWHWVDGTVEQPEPNGIFSSHNTDGTYVLCANDDGTVSPVYTESKVTTFTFPIMITPEGEIVRAEGNPTIVIQPKGGTTSEQPVETSPAPAGN